MNVVQLILAPADRKFCFIFCFIFRLCVPHLLIGLLVCLPYAWCGSVQVFKSFSFFFHILYFFAIYFYNLQLRKKFIIFCLFGTFIKLMFRCKEYCYFMTHSCLSRILYLQETFVLRYIQVERETRRCFVLRPRPRKL